MAHETQQPQLTLLELKDEHRDAFGCVLALLDQGDRLFLSKAAKGLRDVFSFRVPVKRKNNDNDDCTRTNATTASTSTTTTTSEDGEERAVVHARGMVRSAAMARWFLAQGCGDSGYHLMTAAVENGCVPALSELMQPHSKKQIVCNFNDDCRDWSLSRIAAEHGQIEVGLCAS